MLTFSRPAENEYAPYYARYVAAVPEGDLSATLDVQASEVTTLLGGLSDEQARHRYAPGKWSVKEVLGHIIDTERIFAYRVLRIARGDTTPLPGFDQEPYVEMSGADERPLADLIDEFVAVRRSTLLLLGSLPDASVTRAGVASEQPVTARALAYLLAGHVQHHLGVLREHYGLSGDATAS